MKITAVQSADYPEIVELWEPSVRATHPFLAESDLQSIRMLLPEIYLDAVRLCCVRDGRGRLLGFMGTQRDRLEMLFVHPSAFGRGVGRALLRHAVDDLGVSRLDVNEQNPRALGFYKHMGFVVTGRSALDDQGNPYPLLHMELRKTSAGE